MSHRSFSQLSAYAECPERFFLERVRTPRLPETPAAWTIQGTAFHKAYEQWELTHRTTDIGIEFVWHYGLEVARMLEKQPNLNWWNKTPNVKTVEKDIELRRQHGVKQADAYAEHARTSPWKIHDGALEQKFEVSFGEVKVRGASDVLLVWPDEQVTVRDIKTGNKGNVKSNLQLGIYKVALEETMGIKISWGEFWFTKDGTSSGYSDLRRYTRGYLEDLFGALEAGITNKVFLPNPGQHCTFCGVKPWCREMGLVGGGTEANDRAE